MERIIRSLLRLIFFKVYDFVVHWAEKPRILFMRPIDYSELLTDLDHSETTRLALVAPHPTQFLKFSLRHLIGGLIKNDYSVVVLVHDLKKAQWILDEFPNVRFAYRREKGRDFGAWKELIVQLIGHESLKAKLNSFILANDSVYFNANTSEIIKELGESTCPWGCLFENFEHHYHAQSFLLRFSKEAINSESFEKFWNDYRPYSSRAHSINFGEVGLSKALLQELGRPSCLISSWYIVQKWLKAEKEQFPQYIAALEANIHVRRDYEAQLSRLEINEQLSPNTRGIFVDISKVNQGVEKHKFALMLSKLIESHNPTHMVGLLANTLTLAPVKRDVCQRGSFQISDVLRLIKGYDDSEIREIALDLRAKGLPISMRGLQRVLFDAGRI